MKLKKSVKRFLFSIFLILIIIGVVYYIFFYNTKSVKKVKVVNEIKEYGYKLKDNKSEEYKKLFTELKEILESDSVDEDKYAKTIAKMFIIDFYSLDDKLAKTDVGGTDFVHSNALENFKEKAENTMYKYVESNIYGNRSQSLPEVKSVKIESVEKEAFTYLEDVDDDAYNIKVSWTYKDSSNSSGYQKDATLVFVHEDKKLSLVELQ